MCVCLSLYDSDMDIKFKIQRTKKDEEERRDDHGEHEALTGMATEGCMHVFAV